MSATDRSERIRASALGGPDIPALRRRLQALGGRRFWAALDELADTPEFQTWLQNELPGTASLLALEPSRRGVLKAMGASMLLAGLPGCDVYPAEDALPWVEQPEGAVPGTPRFYATMVPFMGLARPVVAECHAGRPTRLDGNARHPAATTALDPFAQAEVLALYDPDRSHGALERGAPVTVNGALERVIQSLDGKNGDRVRLLTGAISSPTMLRQISQLKDQLAGLRWYAFEPADTGERRRATERLFGVGRDVRIHPAEADVIASFEDDLLGPGPFQLVNAQAWSERRRRGQANGDMARLFVAESSPTLTGAKADLRHRTAAGRIPALLAALARILGVDIPGPPLSEIELAWLNKLAFALQQSRGRGLLTAGAHQPAGAQALALALNDQLGNLGKTVTVHEAVRARPDGDIAELTAEMADGNIDTLLMIDVDPLFAACGDLAFGHALQAVPFSVHVGLYEDATAHAATWHLPLAHPFETWTDGCAVDGTAVIGQPLVEPLYGGLHLHSLMAAVIGAPTSTAREIVRQTWYDRLPEPFEESWRRALHDGFVPGTAAPRMTVESPAIPTLELVEEDPQALEVTFAPDPCVWDGRYANIGWLQELPKPLTKLTWDNAALLSPALAEALGLRNGQLIEISVGPRAIEVPAWILPGQAEHSVTLHFGQGRQAIGRVAEEAGTDVNPLRSWASPWRLTDARITPLEAEVQLADTQMHGTMEGSELVRIVAPKEAARPPREHIEPPKHQTLYSKDFDYEGRAEDTYAWAMSIDLDACIGCSACVVACVAENNIMTVGREEVRNGREMHWLRVDRYFEGGLDDPIVHFQPVPCMHCEHAPCELGCPVRATVHGPEGLNQMIYNRCIGTRTCSSYCPYKVRRFNWFDYSQPRAPGIEAQYNPDVTVRARGVMEKCTYCVQRISSARRQAKKEERRIADGEVRTACQTACPTQAIVFGDRNDRQSAVNRAQRERRSYTLLEELNVRPRTSYLARIREDGDDDDGKV